MFAKLKNFFKNTFDLRDGKEEKEDKIVASIKGNIEFRGANLWTLIFAIFIASIGLNINSIAVIIGAMLISPIMGPVIGVGLSLATSDSKLLRKSLKNLSVATVISIIISTIYFLLTPIHNAQSELLARTTPTVYDVLIALFGGLAGIVGSSRAEKDNVIPGVAIATALMPPLCTVGYGIATWQPDFFIGAFYLFLINCVFICLSSLAILKYLGFKSVEYVDEQQKKRTRLAIISIVVVIILPAVYFAYNLVNENNFNQRANTFISDVFKKEADIVVYQNINYHASPHIIEVAFLSNNFTAQDIAHFQSELASYHLTNTTLRIDQTDSSLSQQDWNTILANVQDESDKLKVIQAQINSEPAEDASQILKEAQAINPDIENIAIGSLSFAETPLISTTTPSSSPINQTVLVYMKRAIYFYTVTQQNTIKDWLKVRLNNANLIAYFIPN